MTQQNVMEGLLDECAVDHVGLWELVRAAQIDLGAENLDETRQLTLELVHQLLKHPQILVGHPAPDGRSFLPWSVTPDEACDRIGREWSALGRCPDIGEVAWFTKAN
jgi:hypothetical protein